MEEKYEKEVTVVAYDYDEDYGSLREWADSMVDLNMHERTTETDEWWELVYDLGKGEQTKRLPPHKYDEDRVDKLSKNLEKPFQLRKKSKTEEKFYRSMVDALTQIKRELFERLPEELYSGLPKKESDWDTRWRDFDDENVHPDFEVRILRGSFDKRRVLAKESEREDDDLYETMAEVLSFSVRVKMTAPSQEHINKWTEEVVPSLVKELRGFPQIGKVRFTDCETTVTQRGECYDI